MSCALEGLFPASEARVSLALDDQQLSPEVTLEGDALVAIATASAEQEGVGELVCKVTIGGESREGRENVTVYSKGENWGRGQMTDGRGMGVVQGIVLHCMGVAWMRWA